MKYALLALLVLMLVITACGPVKPVDTGDQGIPPAEQEAPAGTTEPVGTDDVQGEIDDLEADLEAEDSNDLGSEFDT